MVNLSLNDSAMGRPDWAEAYNQLGQSALRHAAFDLAEKSYRKALELDQQLEAARSSLAVLLLKHLGRRAEALEQVDLYLKRHPMGRRAAEFKALLAGEPWPWITGPASGPSAPPARAMAPDARQARHGH